MPKQQMPMKRLKQIRKKIKAMKENLKMSSKSLPKERTSTITL